MKKGDTHKAFLFLASVIVLLSVVSVTWGFVNGKTQYIKPIKGPEETGSVKNETCTIVENCAENPYGAKCLDVNDPNFPERLNFCGCYINDDCQSTPYVARSGVCGQDNRC